MGRTETSRWIFAAAGVAFLGCGGTTTGTGGHGDVGGGGRDGSVRSPDAASASICPVTKPMNGYACDTSPSYIGSTCSYGSETCRCVNTGQNSASWTCGSGNGSGGAAGAGGALGAGGVTCECFTGECAPGTRSVPGSASFCNPPCHTCQPCGPTTCPFMPACAPGQHPITLPGQCCPSSCGPSHDGGATDAGTCPLTTPPACSQNTYPPCAPDWASALSWFTACGFPASGASVAHCGSYNALVTSGFDNGNTYFYDAAGKLIGSQNSYSCEAYDPTFVPLAPLALNSCSPLHPCSVDAGTLPCGSQTCATNQVCVQQKCGGGPNPCVPLPDAGTCPPGWTFDPSCPRSTLGGCDPPPCTNPSPYCADIPQGCLPLVTVSGALCPCADSVCKFGGCVEMFGRNVTCAAQ